jgi:hypothetical protein
MVGHSSTTACSKYTVGLRVRLNWADSARPAAVLCPYHHGQIKLCGNLEHKPGRTMQSNMDDVTAPSLPNGILRKGCGLFHVKQSRLHPTRAVHTLLARFRERPHPATTATSQKDASGECFWLQTSPWTVGRTVLPEARATKHQACDIGAPGSQRPSDPRCRTLPIGIDAIE